MIGPVRDYPDLYVAACGKVLGTYAQGVEHERDCSACRAIATGDLETEEQDDDDGDSDEE